MTIDANLGPVGVFGLRLNDTSSYDNEDAALIAYNCLSVVVDDVEFASGGFDNSTDRDIESYSFQIKTETVDFGASLLSDAFVAKRGEEILSAGGTLSGNVTGDRAKALNNGEVHVDGWGHLTNDNGRLVSGLGFVIDLSTEEILQPANYLRLNSDFIGAFNNS